MTQVIKDIVTWLKQWFYTEKEVDDIVEGLQTQINNKADTTTVSNLSTTVNGKANTSHAHGNLTSDGKVTNASNDTFEYFVGIGNSSNAIYKSQYLKADKVKDTSAHTNIGSSANDTQATINTKIDTALAGKQASGNYATSSHSHPYLPNNANGTTTGTLTATKFINSSSNNTNILLGNGNTLAQSTFATKSHTHTDNDISYTASKSNSVSTIDLAAYEEFNANRLAFLKKENITVEYTTNANAATPTWTAFPSSRDNDKIKLVTTTANFIAGNNATANANNQIRVTLDAGGTYASPNDGSKQSDIYMVTRKILIFSSTGGGSNCKCKVETSTYNEPTTWTETGTYTVAGQSGWNTIPLYITWGGYSSQLTTRVRYIRLTFSTESAKNVSVQKIRLLGETLYTPTIDTNTLASNGHLYKVDESKNGIFPNYITATGYKVNNATGFLKADGTVDSTSYTTATGHTHSYLPLSGGTLTGNVIYPIESNSSSNTAAGNLVWGGAPTYDTDMWTTLRNKKSQLSTIQVPNDKWYNIISVRHRNGSGDGNNYGMYIKTALQNDDGLIWAKQKGASSFMAERTILDSSNYSTYANKTTIANNLTTTTAGSALDATQGKKIQDQIDRYKWTSIPATSDNPINKPYLRLFHFEDTGTSRSGHLIFEVAGRNNDKKYAKIRVDIRRNNTTSSAIKITPLEVMTIDINDFYWGLYYDTSKTCLDIFRKVYQYDDLDFRIYDDTTRQGTITKFAPGPNSTESYTSVEAAATTLYNTSYNNISSGGSYEITANKFIKSGGTSSQILLANGDSKATSDFATSGHTHGYIQSDGTINSDITSFDRILVREASTNKIRTITKANFTNATATYRNGTLTIG